MKHLQMRSLAVTIGAGVILVFGLYLYINLDKFSDLLKISLLPVVLILVLTFISAIINGLITVYLYKGLGINLSVRDGFFLASVSTLANQLPISGGLAARAYYLKRKHGLSYTKFISSTAALFFCFVSANGFIGALILLYDFYSSENTPSLVLLLGFFFMAGSIFVFWLPVERIPMPIKLRGRLRQAVDGWRIIGKEPVLLGKVLSLQTLLMLLLAYRYKLAFQMLSQTIFISHSILFSSASILTQLVSIAPGGLGVTESIVAGVAALLGFDAGVGAVAVGIDRLISLVMIFTLGGIGLFVLGRQFLE